MQISDEIVTVVFWQRHERSTHDDELHLVHAVPELLQLIDSMFGLQIRIISSSDGSHRCGLITGVRLRRILEIRVRPSRAIDADVPRHIDVGASMGLAHDGDHGNLEMFNVKGFIISLLVQCLPLTRFELAWPSI